MNINDALPSKYLKAHDLKGVEPVVTIDRVELEPVGRTREKAPILYFRGKAKGLKLNRTIAGVLSQIAGSPMTEAWSGVVIRLYATTADFGNQTYPVVRVKAVTAAAPVLSFQQGKS